MEPKFEKKTLEEIKKLYTAAGLHKSNRLGMESGRLSEGRLLGCFSALSKRPNTKVEDAVRHTEFRT